MDSRIESYRDLFVWQKSIDLCETIYLIIKDFPKTEVYGLTSQIRRCCVSIPSNIAEGSQRGHRAEYVQFLHIAFGSGAELETQLVIALRVGYITQNTFDKLNELLVEIMKMLNSLIRRLYVKK